MKHAHTHERKNNAIPPVRRQAWLAGLVLLAGMLPGAAQAMTPTSNVPFVQALADARRVVALQPAWRIYQVHGDSMEPQFGDASLLFVAPANYPTLEPGMIALYRDSSGDLVAHRLIALTPAGWVMKGLNNDRMDPGLLTADNLAGVVFGVLHYQAGSEKLADARSAGEPAVAYAKRY